MANFVYTVAIKQAFDGALDLDTSGNDIRMLLLEAGSDVNKDDATVQAVLARAGTTELSSTNYARQALTGEATSQDDANDRAEADADNPTFSNLAQAGSETIVKYLIYKHVTNDADSIPILQADISPAITPNGDFTVNFDAEGYLQGASA